jgi:hypothetical protein
MDCTPQALLDATECFGCLNDEQLNWIETYLLCQWANT